MPNIFGMAFGAVGKGIGLTAKAVTAPTIAKMGMGAGIGGIYGAASAEGVSGMGEGALKGAIFGAAGGGAIGMAPRMARAMPGVAWGASKAVARSGGRFVTGRGVEGFARKATVWAANHPLLVAGTAGATYAGISLASAEAERRGAAQPSESPYLSGVKASIDYNQQAMMMQEMGTVGGGTVGTPSQMRGRFQYSQWLSEVGMNVLGATRTGRFIDSTIGLPQGLHAGRHGS